MSVQKKSSITVFFQPFLLIFVYFFSQFYTWQSGLPQISHFLILLTIFILVINKYKRLVFNKDLRILFIFLIYSICVNSVWMIYYNDLSYLYSTIYWVFNFIFLIVFLNLNEIEWSIYKKYILYFICISFFLEILFFLLGMGRYNFQPRYNGYFNDPNQMAFWVLCSISIYLIISKNKFFNFLVFFVGFCLIILTMSRSATLGLFIVVVGILFNARGLLIERLFYFLFTLLIFVFSAIYAYSVGWLDNIFNRFLHGIEEKDDQLESRGIDILISYPDHIIYGAGQGNYGLFSKTSNEIHSTWIGILFYYGIIGFLIFIVFLSNIFRRLSISDKLFVLGPMVYGFTTYSARTSIFWIFLGIVIYHKRNSMVKNNL